MSEVRDGRRPRGPGIIYASLTTVMLVVLGFVALTATQPSPPTIAEFAPQAVEQITDAPSEQSSEFGRGGEGDCPPGATNCELGDGPGIGRPTPVPGKPPPIDVARVRRCVGDPPRQIEDPQSPPCVPYWNGDNGGETYKGVTGTQINVAIPDSGDEDLRFQAFFNSRFEFYGRKLNLVATRPDHAVPPGSSGGQSPTHQRNAAAKADEERHAFASTNSTFGGGFHYYDELARRGIISAIQDASVSERYMRSRAPHMWQYTMGLDDLLSTTAEWACNRLAGSEAEYAGSLISSSSRKFGVILQQESDDVPPELGALLDGLARCDARPESDHVNIMREGDNQSASSALLRFSTDGVTSIFCLCLQHHAYRLLTAADGQSYEPEWLMTSYGWMDRNLPYHLFPYPRRQLEQMLGLTFQPRQILNEHEPQYWATKETDPGAQGVAPNVAIFNVNVKYRSLLLLASGIQMAGPNLTPSTFERALHRTVFPNPNHPNVPGKVGFQGGRHSMTNDVAEWWWSNSHRGPYAEEGNGTICYIDNGKRQRPGALPDGPAPFFQEPCHNGTQPGSY